MSNTSVRPCLAASFRRCWEGFLWLPIMLLLHADDGGVGWCLLWILLMVLSGVLGAAFSARWWARKHLA